MIKYLNLKNLYIQISIHYTVTWLKAQTLAFPSTTLTISGKQSIEKVYKYKHSMHNVFPIP